MMAPHELSRDVRVEAGDVPVNIVAHELKPFISQALGGKRIPETAELPGQQEVLLDKDARSKTGVSFNLLFPRPQKGSGDEITEEDRNPENVREGVQHDKVAALLDQTGHGALGAQVSALGKSLELDQSKNPELHVTMANNLHRRSEQALGLEQGTLGRLDFKNKKGLHILAEAAIQNNPKLADTAPGDRPQAALELSARERTEQEKGLAKNTDVDRVHVELPALHMPRHREEKLAQQQTIFDEALDAVDPGLAFQPGHRSPHAAMKMREEHHHGSLLTDAPHDGALDLSAQKSQPAASTAAYTAQKPGVPEPQAASKQPPQAQIKPHYAMHPGMSSAPTPLGV